MFCRSPAITVLAVPFVTGLPSRINVKLAKVAVPPTMCLMTVTVGACGGVMKELVIVHSRLAPVTTFEAAIVAILLAPVESETIQSPLKLVAYWLDNEGGRNASVMFCSCPTLTALDVPFV